MHIIKESEIKTITGTRARLYGHAESYPVLLAQFMDLLYFSQFLRVGRDNWWMNLRRHLNNSTCSFFYSKFHHLWFTLSFHDDTLSSDHKLYRFVHVLTCSLNIHYRTPGSLKQGEFANQVLGLASRWQRIGILTQGGRGWGIIMTR